MALTGASSSDVSVPEDMADQTKSTSGELVQVKQENELLVPNEVPTIFIKEEETQDLYYDELTQVEQEMVIQDEDINNWDVSTNEETTMETESIPGGVTIAKQETYLKQEEELLVPDEDASSSGVSAQQDIKDQSKSTCELVQVKQENEMLVPDEVPTIFIKEEEGHELYYDELTEGEQEMATHNEGELYLFFQPLHGELKY
ncbi:uncharacterized protein [Halyomorpha halys]|uniref:uncharacterized protein isoform X9 n=1 Tax=Halyomorpha halys TaxID=286706 RepID=UPI0034D1D0DA